MAAKEKLGKVLIVAGTADAMMNYQLQLSGYTTETALNAEAATDLLDDLEPDVIIIDEKLPGVSGIELAQWIRTDQAAPHYYSILIVTHGKNRDLMDIMKQSGADSACHYDQTRAELSARVDLLLKLKRVNDKANSLIIKLSHTKETIRDLEDQDSITRLYNISYIATRLEKELRHAERFQLHLSFMIVSIEGFYNLTYGKGPNYSIKLLQQVGNDLIHLTRADDIVGRSWGGDFYIILPETKPEGAENLKIRMTSHVQEQTYGLDGDKVTIEFNFGITTVTGEVHAQMGMKEILTQAEDALKSSLLLKASRKMVKIANS
ncbi:MAG: diguanylate cyclase [Chitinophagaceae bacterium]|nr:diguanylate cyclase [Oligoflexus sp.]